MNPYRPRVKSSVQFTPLQRTSICPPQMGLTLSNAPSIQSDEVYLGEVLVSEPPAGAIVESVPSNVVTESEEPVAKTKVEAPDFRPDANPIEKTEVGSIPSPSDIVTAPQKPVEPTPADVSTRISSRELSTAQAEIERLTVELEAAKQKTRTASDRAYAAERAAAAAAKNAELKLQEVQEMAAKQLRKTNRSSGARKLVEQLESEAKAKKGDPVTRQPPRKPSPREQKKQTREKANQDRTKTKQADADESEKSNRGRFSGEVQIKQLNESMKRQIETSSKQITRRYQKQLDKLLGEGKKESDPKMLEINQKLKAELEKNEAKIRNRIEQRIQRIKKEAAARAKS